MADKEVRRVCETYLHAKIPDGIQSWLTLGENSMKYAVAKVCICSAIAGGFMLADVYATYSFMKQFDEKVKKLYGQVKKDDNAEKRTF